MPENANPPINDRVLFVDDDQHLLDGYERLLHGEFRVQTACSACEGLASIQLLGPFAIVISDMRMPGLNGAEFLARVRDLEPNTVRMVLTGHKDLKRAIASVNDGQVFRYLTKPCLKDDMVKVIRLGLEQYRINVETAEMFKKDRDQRLQAPTKSTRERVILNLQ